MLTHALCAVTNYCVDIKHHCKGVHEAVDICRVNNSEAEWRPQ